MDYLEFLFAGLPEAHKAAIVEATQRHTTAAARDAMRTFDDRAYQDLVGVLESLDDPDLASFRGAVQSVVSGFSDANDPAAEWIAAIQSAS